MAPLLPVEVSCVSDEVLQSLLQEIQRWQGEPGNEHTNLDHPSSGWTGRFFTGFLQTKPASWSWSAARRNLTSPAATMSSAVQVLNLKETRDLLARVKFIYQGTLTRTCVAELLPNAIVYRPEDPQSTGMTNELIKVANDGTFSILTRTFYWVLWKVKEDAFMAINRSNEVARQAFWFTGLNRFAVVWLLKYLRDAIDFEWCIEAADNNAEVPGRYTAAETQRARHVLHMLRLRLVHAAEAVFLYMVDKDPYEGMTFPTNEGGLASAAQYWRQGFQTFTRSETFHVPLEEWPLRVELQYRKKRVATVAGPNAVSEAFAID